uniref:Uncharacterized protein n=1 Tax=Micrurus paraensis TaxID=1970185 RepID=A0A2D4K0J5_9SAUR
MCSMMVELLKIRFVVSSRRVKHSALAGRVGVGLGCCYCCPCWSFPLDHNPPWRWSRPALLSAVHFVLEAPRSFPWGAVKPPLFQRQLWKRLPDQSSSSALWAVKSKADLSSSQFLVGGSGGDLSWQGRINAPLQGAAAVPSNRRKERTL